MEREKNNNGNTVLLTVIGVATLLVALVGATFAYFSATIDNKSAQSVTITTANPVGLVYTGQKLEMANIIPGDPAKTSTFTVNNPSASTVDQSYDLTLIIDENGLTTNAGDQLVLDITSSTDGTSTMKTTNYPTALDVTDGATAYAAGKTVKIVDDQPIKKGETQTYTLKVEFKDKGVANNDNTNANFRAHIEISDPKGLTTE